jgi:DNA-binding MarR family transcriptional regulator
MNQSLKEFRNNYQELLLNFLWRQWSALGVAGYGIGEDKWFVDPEALLIFTSTIARVEPRLFDEVLDWLTKNGNFINIQHLKTILKRESFSGEKVISAIAGVMVEKEKSAKWKRLATQSFSTNNLENLFFQKNGRPMEMFGQPETVFQKYGFHRGKLELRGYSQPVRIVKNTGILFKLRALFGINTRAEIMLYLLTHESAHPRKIARETYYAQKTVQDILIEMAYSGLIYVRPVGREKHYWLKTNEWLNMLSHNKEKIIWINWPPLFSALEQIWQELNKEEFYNLDSLTQSSELRIIMQSVREKIETAGFEANLSNEKIYLGEDYINVFLSDIKSILG